MAEHDQATSLAYWMNESHARRLREEPRKLKREALIKYAADSMAAILQEEAKRIRAQAGVD
jgi:hypothetical protein